MFELGLGVVKLVLVVVELEIGVVEIVLGVVKLVLEVVKLVLEVVIELVAKVELSGKTVEKLMTSTQNSCPRCSKRQSRPGL